jgi:D-aspartate ligase
MPLPLHEKPGAIVIEGHVQGLSNTRSLGEAGIPVFVVDTGDCVAAYSRYCSGFYRCPPFHRDELADWLIELACKKGLKDWLLLPSNDHAVLTLSRNKARLEGHFKVITAGLEVIDNIYDKLRLVGTATDVAVPVPKTFCAGDRNDGTPHGFSLTFPVLIRGRFGLDFYKATGRKAFLASDKEEMQRQLTAINRRFPLEKTLVQELIPDDGTNKTISYCAFCVQGEIKAHWMGEKVRQHPLRFGTATFAKSVRVMACHRQSVPLLNALKYTGVCEVEYLKDPRDGLYKLIEINARTWLWVGLAKACGVDFAKICHDFVQGEHIEYPTNFEQGVCWINPWSDTAYSLLAILKGRLGLGPYINSLTKNKLVSLYSAKDPYPFFAYLLLMLKYLKAR